ncbi:MAG: DUF4861 domain-containing protein [Deinococcales bacterium]|nr:DUF4861 domain-containing protein [Chitinophagaceae bacterium]
MRKFAFIFCLFFSGKLIAQSPAFLTIKNPSSTERIDELIILKKTFLEKKIGKKLEAKFITIKKGNNLLTVQFDDIDKDGQWDEAAILYSFKPKETIRFQINITNQTSIIDIPVRAYVRHRKKDSNNKFGINLIIDTMPINNIPTDFSTQRLPPYLTEGPAWENDKVGFRKYFDVRNANDIWGKTTKNMVLDFVGTNPDSSYHNLHWWGMDILKVGKSLGAGGLALSIKKNNGKDTLIRLGANAKVIYKQLANGPLRIVFTITYTDMKLTEVKEPITVVEQISIWGGQYFYENKVTIQTAAKDVKIVTGIPVFYKVTQDSFTVADAKVFYTYGNQSENKDELGLAIVTSNNCFPRSEKYEAYVTDITNSYLVVSDNDKKNEFIYRSYACWGRSQKVFTKQYSFIKFLKQQALNFLPVNIQ